MSKNIQYLIIGIIFGVLLRTAHCQERGDSQYGNQFPNAPEPIKAANGSWAHDSSQDPPKWYQHTFTKKFDLAIASLVGSNIADIELTQHCESSGKCIEGGGDAPAGGHYESRGEMYRNDMLADGAIIGLSILFQSRHLPKKMGWIAYIGPVYGTAVHIHGAINGARLQ